jgi:ferredoxin-type protein NapH
MEKRDGKWRLNIADYRLGVQLSWLLVINSMLLGVAAFTSYAVTRYVFWPNLSCRFILNDPTTCVLHETQMDLIGGAQQLYLNLILPLMIFVMLILMLGRVWCGWLCPVLCMQELFGRARRTAGVAYTEMSSGLVLVLSRAKYAFLLIIMWGVLAYLLPRLPSCLSTRTAISCEVCPARPFCIWFQQGIGLESLATKIPWWSMVVFAGVVVSSMKVRDPWCHVCPLGAMQAPFNRHALVKLEKDGTKCTRCRVCLRVCPMDIEEIYDEVEATNVTHEDCIHCYRCVEKCPEDGCLNVTFLGKRIYRSKRKW